jgi:hypothetical protein
LAIFTKNLSTVPFREKSLIQGGPIKGQAWQKILLAIWFRHDFWTNWLKT